MQGAEDKMLGQVVMAERGCVWHRSLCLIHRDEKSVDIACGWL